MLIKVCKKCGEEKPTDSFYKHKKNKDGLTSYCKPCHGSYQTPGRKREYSARWYQKRKEENPALFMWKQAKHRAKWDYHDMEFSITVEDIIIPEKCPYLNVPLIPLDKELGYSLDRIDSSKGYTKDNIEVISYKANRMKSDATEAELLAFAEGVLRRHTKGGTGRVD